MKEPVLGPLQWGHRVCLRRSAGSRSWRGQAAPRGQIEFRHGLRGKKSHYPAQPAPQRGYSPLSAVTAVWPACKPLADDVAALLGSWMASARHAEAGCSGKMPRLIAGPLPKAIGPITTDMRRALDERCVLTEARAGAVHSQPLSMPFKPASISGLSGTCQPR